MKTNFAKFRKMFETVTTRLLFSKLLLILLFSHKILIFLKINLGGPNLLLDPQFYSGRSMDSLDPPVADPMQVYTYLIYVFFYMQLIPSRRELIEYSSISTTELRAHVNVRNSKLQSVTNIGIACIETLGEWTAPTTPGGKHQKASSLEFLLMLLQLISIQLIKIVKYIN